jgi:hypothetical protein
MHRYSRRFGLRLLVLSLTCGFAALLATATSGGATATTVPKPIAPPIKPAPIETVAEACAHAAPTTSVQSVAAPEATADHARRVVASVVHFGGAQPGGESRVPPRGWQPSTATASELRYFGIPLRPSDPAGRKAWNNEWIDHFTGFGTPKVCEPISSNSANVSYNWAGEMSIVANTTTAYGSEVVHAGSPCVDQPDSYPNPSVNGG